jgi:hypothetical protein
LQQRGKPGIFPACQFLIAGLGGDRRIPCGRENGRECLSIALQLGDSGADWRSHFKVLRANSLCASRREFC